MNNTIYTAQGAVTRAVLAIALAGSCALAQNEVSAPEVELSPVTVSAHGLAVPYDHSGVSVSIIDLEEMRREGISNLGDAVMTSPGVYAQSGGGSNQRGNSNPIAIRGMSSGAYTLTVMDGMRLGNSDNNGNATANILARNSVQTLGNLEVLRGAQAAVYGGGAVGGVIFMETPEGAGPAKLRIFNEAGSFDSYSGAASLQGRQDKLGYFVSAGYDRSNNDWTYADGSHPQSKHAGLYRNWREDLRLDAQLNEDNSLSLTYHRSDADFHYSSPYSADTYKFRSNLVTAKWESKISEKYSSSLMAGFFGNDNRFSADYNNEQRNLQLEWRNSYEWNEKHSSTGGLAWNRNDFNVPSSTKDSSLENIYAAFIEHCYRPLPNWENSLALRWEQSSIDNGMPSFRAASSYAFNEEKSRLFGSLGSGYRSPSQFQRSNGRYEYFYSVYQGNPDLKAEKVYSADLGFEQKLTEAQRASATLFWIRQEDAIASVYRPADACVSFENSRGHWTSQGLELALNGEWDKTWKPAYRLAFTYTQPKSSDGSPIPSTARQVYSADLHCSPVEKLTIGLGLQAAADRQGFYSNGSCKWDNFYSLRFYAQYELNSHITLHMRVENLTNQKFVTEGSDYTGVVDPSASTIAPGCAIYGGCSICF